MVKCVECDKVLGFLEGYRHPILDKNHLLCSSCFDQVSESVEKWRNVVLPYVDFFNNSPSKNNLQLKIKNSVIDLFDSNKTVYNTKSKENYVSTEINTLI
ncbi:MAG: hypothetical protein JSV67_00045 [Thermoplasmatales archaeon]|nr:MAG: hypothetical protein JSV67_00045 [Thermoplasmatales archaeon]